MEFEKSVLVRITKKEAKGIANLIVSKSDLVGYSKDELVNVIADIIVDYEFDQEVTVSYDPEPMDEP